MRSGKLSILLLLVGSVPALPAFGQPAHLVRDLVTEDEQHWPVPAALAQIGERLIFRAFDPLHGSELWSTDGTAAGTSRLGDLTPGLASSIDSQTLSTHRWIEFRDSLYFVTTGQQLWRTDGTPSGTVLLSDRARYGTPLVATQDEVLFLPPGKGMWRTDGTREGTSKLAGIPEERIDDLELAGRRVLFRIGLLDGQLWQAGIGEPATRLTHLPGMSDLYPFDGERVLVAQRSYSSMDPGPYSLWLTDSTETGTVRLLAVPKGGFAIFCRNTSACLPEDGFLNFSVNGGPDSGVWRTDGTPEGTERLAGSPPDSWPLQPINEDLLFYVFAPAPADAEALDLWRGNFKGTSAPTLLAKFRSFDVGIGKGFQPLADRVYFSTDDAFWQTDGTPEGTEKMITLTSRRIGPIVDLGGELLFGTSRAYRNLLIDPIKPAPFDLWLSDGSELGTRQFFEFPEIGASAEPIELRALDDEVLFRISELRPRPPLTRIWRSDGTDSGTRRFFDLGVEEQSDHAIGLGSNLYYGSGRGFYRSDGSQAVPLLLLGEPEPGAPAYPTPFSRHTNSVLFWVVRKKLNFSDETTAVLWRTDGTEEGTQPISDVITGQWSFLASQGNLTFFTVGRTLWRTDGTKAGTEPVFHGNNTIRHAAMLGGRLFFDLAESSFVESLWRSDGTPAGTTRVVELPGFLHTDPVATETRLFFPLRDPHLGMEIWVSDGTAAGTHVVRDIYPGPADSFPTDIIPIGDGVLFAAEDGEHGRELWYAQAPNHARLVADILPGPRSADPQSLRNVAGQVLLAADDGRHGLELWRSDATAQGTFLLQDIAPGPDASSPDEFTEAGSRVFFAASHRETGRELWAADLATLSIPPPLRLVDDRFEVEVTWINQHRNGDTGFGRGKADSPNTGLFSFFDPENPELIVKVLDGRPVNGHFWVFYGALTDLEYTLTVTDRTTGLERRYYNPPGSLCGGGDTAAFDASSLGLMEATLPFPDLAALSDLGAPTADRRPGGPDDKEAGSCSASAERLCLHDRFSVTVRYQNQHASGSEGSGFVRAAGAESGSFWFFDPDNTEVVVKILDGRPVNGHFWFFATGLTDLAYTVRIDDAVTGASHTYESTVDQICGTADTAAF